MTESDTPASPKLPCTLPGSIPGPSIRTMRALISVALAIAVAIVATDPLPANEAPPPAAELPPAIGSDVVAVLRIDDSRWLMEQLNSAIGGNGQVAARGHALFSEVLYNCRSTTSIDPTRPSLIAWRSGDAPLVAVIPFIDRERFLEDFGSLRLIRRLLVRTGEREGTVVYNQVTPAGTWEYRLMLRDGYAYLARSKEECLLLADQGLDIDTDAAPIRMAWRGSYLAQTGEFGAEMSERLQGPGQSLVGPVAVALISGWRSLLSQVSLLELRLEPGIDGSLGLRLSCGAKSETALATWISRQSNAGSRLLPLVTRPGDVLTGHGSFRWQGELERLGRDLAKQLATDLGSERFTEQMNADMRSYFTLLDRQGAFAAAVGVLGEGEGRVRVARVIAEQPNAAELITLERGLDKLFMDEGDEVGEFDAVSGLLAYRKV
jgi:hypothetical protein